MIYKLYVIKIMFTSDDICKVVRIKNCKAVVLDEILAEV